MKKPEKHMVEGINDIIVVLTGLNQKGTRIVPLTHPFVMTESDLEFLSVVIRRFLSGERNNR